MWGRCSIRENYNLTTSTSFKQGYCSLWTEMTSERVFLKQLTNLPLTTCQPTFQPVAPTIEQPTTNQVNKQQNKQVNKQVNKQ